MSLEILESEKEELELRAKSTLSTESFSKGENIFIIDLRCACSMARYSI